MGLFRLRAGLLLVSVLAPVVSAQADFSIGVSPSSQTVWQAWTVSSLVTITPLNGFSAAVGFTTSGLPAGATASFNPAAVSGSGVTTMTISAGPGVPTGTYSVTVTGTSGSLSHGAGVALSVVVPPPISYTYDAVGRLTSVTDQLGSSAIYNYDSVGNVLSISRQNAGQVTISAFSPASGPTGTAVTILGSGFSPTLNQNSVQFNGTSATVTSASNTLLTATVPGGATTGLVTISVSGGMPVTSSSSFAVTSTPGAPTITSFTPTIVAQGTGISINGANFSTNLASNTVKVAATALPVQGATTSLLSTSAPLSSGSGHISVQTPYGTATSTDDLFFVPAPYTEASVALATRATLGTSITATFTRAGLVAIILFDGTAGESKRLLFNTSQNPFVTIYNPDGTVLLASTQIAPFGASMLDTPTLGATGTYAVQIIASPDNQGQVSFTLTNPVTGNDFTLSAVPEFYQNAPTGPGFEIFANAGTGVLSGVNFSTSGLPACATPMFTPNFFRPGRMSRLTFTLAGCLGGSYPFTVTGVAGSVSRSISLTLNVNPIPAGWSEGNINTTIGYAQYSGGTFTVNGGPGPYNPNDVAHFAYQTLNGDGSIVARIASNYTAPDNPQQAFGGVMIRENLTPGSSAKLMNLRLASQAGAQLLWEPPVPDGADTSSLILPGISAPYWLKISRQGNTFLAFMAPDGSNWTQVGSATTISMATSVLIGLTAANTNQGAVAQVVFDNVTITSSPDFSTTVTPSSQSVVPGGTANYTESIGALGGFTGTVTFTVSGLPSGTTASFTPSSVAGSGNSTLAVVTTGSTPFGSYPLIITATSGSLSHATNVTLTVANADFSISASPSSQTINVNGMTTYTLTVSALNGFAGTVNLSVTGVPSGASATVNPTSVIGSGTATVTVTAGANTPQRTYPLTFVGTSGTLTHSASANLVVASTDFSMSLDTGWMLFPAAGGPANRTLTVTPANGFAKTVTLSATGLPAGTTVTFNPATVTTSGTSTVTITTPAGLAPGLLTANIVGTVIDTAGGNPSHSIPISLITQPGGTLPSPWVNQDIGSVGITGSSGYSNGAFTVQSSGTGITGTSDQFQFLYQPLAGDGTIIARLVSLQNPTGNSRVGVMIRETLAVDSAHALMGFQGLPDSGGNRETNFYTRPSTGASTTASNGTNGPTTPIWLKLQRQGSTFTGWYSTDGFSWTQQSVGWTATISMASTVYIGLAVGDDTNTAAKTAVFDSVTVTGPAADFYIVPTFFSRTVSNSANSSYDSLRIVGLNGFTGTTSFSTGGLPSGITASVSPSSLNGSGAVVLTLNSAGGTSPGTYPFTFTGTSGSLTHTANLNVTVDSSAPAPLAPWASEDLGVPTLSGSTTFLNGTISMQAGDGSSGSPETFRFSYQPLAGNSTIIARIDSDQFPQDGARGGIMIRETLETGSAFAFVGDIRQGSAVTGFQYRLASNGTTTTTFNSVTLTKPYWVKLTRVGSALTGSVSPDGIRWSDVGSQTIAMSPTVFVGFAVNSGSTTAYANATFSSFSPTTLSDYYLSLIPTTQAAPNGITRTYYSVVLNPLNGFNAVVNYTASGLPSGATASFGSGSSPTLTITTNTTVGAGTYPFTITGTSGTLVHTTSGTLIVNSGAANTLPAPWSNIDVGTSATGTGASYSNGVFTGTGAGCCLSSGSSDSGQFIYQPLTSDGVIVAKINQNGGAAGLMIRETLSPDSVAAFIGQVSGNATWFATRATIGAPDSRTSGSYLGAPFWAKLQRQGNNLSGYISNDGLTWTQVGSTTSLTMASTVFIGMMASPEGSGTSSATFSSVAVANGSDFYLTQAQTTVPNAGSPAVFSVNVNSLLGFTGSVTLTASGLPSGATPGFSPISVTGGSGLSTLTITTTTSLSGNYGFTITGTSGTLTRTVGATLSVKNFTVSATPTFQILNKSTFVTYTITINAVNGFNATVTPSVATLPAHVTATWNPTTVTSYTNGVGTTTLTLTSTAQITSGTTNMTVTGTSGSDSQTAPISVQTNTSATYSLSVSPASQTIQASANATYNVTMTVFNSFNSTVTLSTSGCPTGATCTFSPTSLTTSTTQSTLTVATTRSTPVTTSTITVNGSVSSIYPSPTAGLTTTAPPDFSVVTSANSATVPAGTNATYTVFLVPSNVFSSPVTFSVSGLPAGAVGTFSPTSISKGPGQTTLTVTTNGVATGATNFTITGTCNTGPCGASLVRTTTGTLTVGSSADFSVGISSPRDFILQNNSTSWNVNVAAFNGFTSTVSLSTSNVPSGVTATFNPTSVTGAGSSSLSLSVGSSVTPGTYSITITGTSGSITHNATYTLVVTSQDFTFSASPFDASEVFAVGTAGATFAYDLSFTPLNGFNSPSTFGSNQQPSCVVTTPNFYFNGQNQVISDLMVDVSGCTTANLGTYTFPIWAAAYSGQLHSSNLVTMKLVDYTVSSSPTSKTISKGSNGTYTISITKNPSFSQSAALSISGLPPNVTAGFSPTSTSTTSTLTLTVGTHATSGTYNLTVTGVIGNQGFGTLGSRTVGITLIIP